MLELSRGGRFRRTSEIWIGKWKAWAVSFTIATWGKKGSAGFGDTKAFISSYREWW